MNEQLSMLDDNERLQVYNTIVNGCQHLWSKGKLQKDRYENIKDTFASLAERDPYFLAHFVSYAIRNLDSKDLKVVATFFNSLSDADGTPFFYEEDGEMKKSDYSKPNLRLISQSAIQELDPKLVSRVIELANLKMPYGEKYGEGTHFSKALKTAIKKYIRFREQNPKAIEGIKNAGLGNIFSNLYRMLHIAPSTESAEILRWEQKDGRKIRKRRAVSFDGLNDLEIAEKIREKKIKPLVALGALPDKIPPVIAVAILEQATGNQAIILHSMFEKQGLLQDKEVQKLFEEKISTAKDAIDRIERINSKVNEDIKKVMSSTKSKKRKEAVGDIGRIYLHLDISPSMSSAIEFAKDRGAIIAECVQNPEENFFWGAFNDKGYVLQKPKTFDKGGFMQVLYGIRDSGWGTNCLACYKDARDKNCDVDVYVTDQGHNGPSITKIINQDGRKPRAAVIVDFSSYNHDGSLYNELIRNGIPTTVMSPNALKESALVAQAVKTAMVGRVAVIDEIMQNPLLELPKWWSSVPNK